MPELSPEQLRARLEELLLAEDAWGHTRTELAELGPAAAPVLFDLIQERPHDTKFTERAILALGELGGAAEALFVISLLDDPDPMVKLAALTALREVGELPDATAVHQLLNDDSPSVRKEAVKTLTALGDESSVAPLRSVAASDPEEYVREQALQAADEVEKRSAPDDGQRTRET